MRVPALVLLILLAGCGTSNFYDAASGTMTQAQAQGRLTDLTSASRITFGAPAQIPNTGRSLFEGCTTVSPSSIEDADGDNIPKEKAESYYCTDISHGSLFLSLRGQSSARDLNEASTSGGYRFERNGVQGGHRNADGSQTENYSYDGFWEMTGSAADFVYQSNFRGTSSNVDTRSGTSSTAYGSTWSHALKADDAADPAKAGTITFAGFYGYSLSDSSDPSKNVSFVLSAKSADLRYKRDGCSSYYESGSLEFTDAASNTLKLEFSSCVRTCKFNGTAFSC